MWRLEWHQQGSAHCQDYHDREAAADAAELLGGNYLVRDITLRPLAAVPCERCRGRGGWVAEDQSGTNYSFDVECPACRGSGLGPLGPHDTSGPRPRPKGE
jgi:hypothetical protein